MELTITNKVNSVFVCVEASHSSKQFSVMFGGSNRFLGITRTFGVQGHNTAELNFETQTSRSEVQFSTTVPPRTQKLNSELLVPIDLGGYSSPLFPATHMFLASCVLIAEVRIHGNVSFFSFVLVFSLALIRFIKQPWSRMTTRKAKATSHRRKNGVL